MSRQTLAVAVVLPVTAGVCAVTWFTGLAWPIATTFYRLFASRPVLPETKGDWC